MTLTATGTLQYDPRATSVEFTQWCLILKCDYDWFRKTEYDTRGQLPQTWMNVIDQLRSTGSSGKITDTRLGLMGKMLPPPWGCHVSVFRQERPTRNVQDWGRYLNGKVFKFEFDPEPWYNSRHIWYSIRCEDLLDVREYFGLPRNPRVPLHLSVGHWDEYVTGPNGMKRNF